MNLFIIPFPWAVQLDLWTSRGLLMYEHHQGPNGQSLPNAVWEVDKVLGNSVAYFFIFKGACAETMQRLARSPTLRWLPRLFRDTVTKTQISLPFLKKRPNRR